MPDTTHSAPDLSLVIGPQDAATFITACSYQNRRGHLEHNLIYAVVHRRFGVWTHVYRVVPDRVPTCLTVYLEKAIEGDCVDEAREWALDRFNAA